MFTLECAGLEHRKLIIGQSKENLRCRRIIEGAGGDAGDFVGIKVDKNGRRIGE